MCILEKFRWAYIGSGNIAHSTARDIVKGAHCIVSVYSRNFEKAKVFAEKYGAQAFADFESAVNRTLPMWSMPCAQWNGGNPYFAKNLWAFASMM